MEGHKWGKERDLQRKMNVFDEEKDTIRREMDVEKKSSRLWSPRTISPLTGIVVAEETHVDARKTEKGGPLLADFESENKCLLKLSNSISYLL